MLLVVEPTVKARTSVWESCVTAPALSSPNESALQLRLNLFKMESCASELMSFISALILVAICDMMDFDILGEFTTTEAIERYVLWVIRLMHLLREGVPILYCRTPPLY